ncbi:hypothetical protein GCM10022223_09000 [Kineosporia mesophila]|uniref:Uncharacterized protein n=1 Tax=Kineosporia mesophila TaxID=566012 RepID=A0ABP6Z1P8_9ACTN
MAFAVLLPVVLVLVVLAGFTHPWNAGGGITAGTYTRDYSVTRQVRSEDLERCVSVTLTGTMSATYHSPAWSLGGPGWTDTALASTSIDVHTTDTCGDGKRDALVDGVVLTQFWATQTCDEPDRGEWRKSMRLGDCDQDLVAGIGGRRSAVSASRFTSSFSGAGALGWRGTTYGDSVCLDGAVSGDVDFDDTTDGLALDGYRICLDPDSATKA